MLRWFGDLARTFGWHYLAYITAAQHLIKGLMFGGGQGGLVGTAFQYEMRRRHVAAAQMVLMQVCLAMPWSLKPILAAVNNWTQSYKRHWVVLLALVCGPLYIVFGVFLPWMPLQLMVALGIILFLQVSWTDLMTEATTADLVRDSGKAGPALMTYTWAGTTAMGLLAMLVVGPILDYCPGSKGPRILLGMCTSFAVLVAPAAWFHWFKDRHSQIEPSRKMTHVSIGIGALIILSMLGLLFIPFLWLRTALVVVCAAISVVWVHRVANPWTFRLMLFSFLLNATSINISSVVFYFYTDTADDCPTCPHFSATFYQTWWGIVDNLASLLGTVLFQRFMTGWTYRRALVTTQLAGCALALLDILQFTRWITPQPLPDEVLALGKGAFQNTVAMLAYMPVTTAISRVCPEGQETVTYALLAGFSNFGLMFASVLGAAVLEFSGLDQVAGQPGDDFTLLPWVAALILVPSVLMTALVPVFFPRGLRIDKPILAVSRVDFLADDVDFMQDSRSQQTRFNIDDDDDDNDNDDKEAGGVEKKEKMELTVPPLVPLQHEVPVDLSRLAYAWMSPDDIKKAMSPAPPEK
jgi:hypothetical protein